MKLLWVQQEFRTGDLVQFAAKRLNGHKATVLTLDVAGGTMLVKSHQDGRGNTILTDDGIHFTTPGASGSVVPLIKEAIANVELFRAHSFKLAYAENDIEHRLTKPKPPGSC